MLAPINWLKKYVEITLPIKDLMWRLTEIGLTCEKIEKINNEDVLDIETTANRPDWMSILGIAREIAAIENKKLRLPKTEKLLLPQKDILPIKLNTDFNLFERWTAISIANVKIKESPKWIQDALKSVNLRPINNIVDITNFVMFEIGLPMHAFDYDEIKGKEMTVFLSKGGEDFTSVDEISYKLPKNAMIIKDKERIIDLAGIKGGLNSGIKSSTKNIFLHITINNPAIIRRTSIAMGLRSDASAIYERGPDKGGTVEALKRAVSLIEKYAGGKPASKIIDLKKHDFKPEKKEVTSDSLCNILGIEIKKEKILSILESLDLSPEIKKEKIIVCTIPTRRADIKAEEDLAEEVARIYGYNNFPKTLPRGETKREKIPYFKDHSTQKVIRELLIASGFSETMNYSLISEENLKKCLWKNKSWTKIENPVSKDFEILRPSIIPSLLHAARINQEKRVLKLFEIDKVYPSEKYKVAAIAKGIDFRSFKGVIETIFEKLNIKDYKILPNKKECFYHQAKSGIITTRGTSVGAFGKINPEVAENLKIEDETWLFELDIESLDKLMSSKIYQPLSPYPPQIEDITLTFPPHIKIGDVINSIKKTSSLIKEIKLKDKYENSWTFKIIYQSQEKTLNDREVEKIRNKIIKKISRLYKAKIE